MLLIFKNKLFNLIGSVLIIGGMLSCNINASLAENIDKSSVLVVDTQILLEKSTAIIKVKEQLEKKAEEFKKDSSAKETSFKKRFEDLEKQKSVLSKDAFEQKNNELAKEFGDAQKKVQESRALLEKVYGESMQQFEKGLAEVISSIVAKENASVVIPKAQLLFSSPNLDITSQVLDALNKKLPTIAVKF